MITFKNVPTPNSIFPLPTILWKNQLIGANIVASSSAAGTFASNVVGPQTFDFWKPAAMPATLDITLPSSQIADSILIAGPDVSNLGLSVVVQGSAGLISSFINVTDFSFSENSLIVNFFSQVSIRRWRLIFSGALAPSISIVMIGRRMNIPAMVAAPYVPLRHARRVELLAGNSLGGQMFDTRIKRLGGDARIGFNPVPREWARDTLPDFANHYDAGLPFMFASSPSLNPTDVAYARRAQGAGELRPEWRAGGRFVDMALEVETYGA